MSESLSDGENAPVLDSESDFSGDNGGDDGSIITFELGLSSYFLAYC